MCFYLSILDPNENMQFVLKEITSRGGMSAGKKMGYVNHFTKVTEPLRSIYTVRD